MVATKGHKLLATPEHLDLAQARRAGDMTLAGLSFSNPIKQCHTRRVVTVAHRRVTKPEKSFGFYRGGQRRIIDLNVDCAKSVGPDTGIEGAVVNETRRATVLPAVSDRRFASVFVISVPVNDFHRVVTRVPQLSTKCRDSALPFN